MSGRMGELLLILLIILVVFGAGKLPRVMGELGKGVKALRNSMKDDDHNKTTTDNTHNLEDKGEE